MLMHCVSGYVLTWFTFPVHRTDECWTEGDKPVMDFGEHLMVSTHDHSLRINRFFQYLFFAGFNDHVLHHLFPTIDGSKLKLVRDIFEFTINEFDLDYKV
jgi:hypothetical protein